MIFHFVYYSGTPGPSNGAGFGGVTDTPAPGSAYNQLPGSSGQRRTTAAENSNSKRKPTAAEGGNDLAAAVVFGGTPGPGRGKGFAGRK